MSKHYMKKKEEEEEVKTTTTTTTNLHPNKNDRNYTKTGERY